MPSLHRATLFLINNHDGWLGETVDFVWFLEKHGQWLKQLQIRGLRLQEHIPLGRSCPRLEHFVLHVQSLEGRRDWENHIIISHPTLRRIDVWLSSIAKPSEDMKDALLRHTQKTCPALQGMRLLDYALVHLPQLPFLLPPTAVLAPRDEYAIEFLGFHLRHTSWSIFAIDQQIGEPHPIRDWDNEEPEEQSNDGSEGEDPDWSWETGQPLADDPTDEDWTEDPDAQSDTSSEFSEGELEDLFAGSNSEGVEGSMEFFSSYDSE
ncbi:hypothetical protein BKA70DRAFT_1255382 [Coprinopsis sp. MPI-PUGE-AT-0042]|nr:hypothetical protein BKA70DRAFT_1255382 [Coprinopsis sp. MPI-PUGE-AT-0042]